MAKPVRVEVVSSSPPAAVVVPSLWCWGRRLCGFHRHAAAGEAGGVVWSSELPVSEVPLPATLQLEFHAGGGGDGAPAAAKASVWLTDGWRQVHVPSRLLGRGTQAAEGWLLKVSPDGRRLEHCFVRLVRATATRKFAMVKMTIKNPAKTLTMEVEPTDLVSSVKEKIRDQEGIPPAEQLLIFGGKLMEDHLTLAEILGDQTKYLQDKEFHLVLKLGSN